MPTKLVRILGWLMIQMGAVGYGSFLIKEEHIVLGVLFFFAAAAATYAYLVENHDD